MCPYNVEVDQRFLEHFCIVYFFWGGGAGGEDSFLADIMLSTSQLPWNPHPLVTLSLSQTVSLTPWAMILKNAIREIFCVNAGLILCVLFLSV